ncbi:MAG: TIGR04282 family arsenosugar biosynthesis glycosyltransferase [Wenzhouxiangella sp.]
MSAVAIFVKTPGLSRVKTRLAASIGAERAIECHLRCAATVAAVASAASAEGAVGPVYWAVAESAGMDDPRWTGLPSLLQRGEGLGERMRSIHDALCERHGAGILIGADLPQLTTAQLALAARHLQSGPARGVLGPACDGGFWLFGANQPLPSTIWQKPHYGGDRVARDLLNAIGTQLAWRHLPSATDLDQGDDLDAVIADLRALQDAHPVQSELLLWLEKLRHSLTPD